MANLVRVAPGVLIVGKPLPWTVYDSEGNVLLRQGYVIQTESQLEQLFERGLFHPRNIGRKEEEAFDDTRARNPFTDYPMLLKTLESTLSAITDRDPSALKRLLGLSRLVERICQEAPDPCLALVHLYSVEPTIYEQTLFYAILCHFTAQRLGLDQKRASVLIGSALTANLALLPVADKLNASRRTLTKEQRMVIHKHPDLSIKALEDAGITNRLLLKTISQHHEQPDGSGYPAGLTGTDILPEAQILALAERYVAMITRRAYRKRFSITEALKSIQDSIGESPRPAVPKALLAVLTPHPPGALVRLANTEVAVVTQRPVRHRGPFVKAIIGPQGKRYVGTFERDCSILEFNIRAIEQPDIMPSMDFGLFWGAADQRNS